MRNNDLFFVDVDLVHVSAEKIYVPNHFANRINDVGQIKVARRDFVQHRSEQEKVLAINNRDFELRVPTFLELQRCVKPAETAAEYEDTRFLAHRNQLKNAALQPE
jgi:hypothetical protein